MTRPTSTILSGSPTSEETAVVEQAVLALWRERVAAQRPDIDQWSASARALAAQGASIVSRRASGWRA